MPELPDATALASPDGWNRLIESIEPASLLVVIEQRMSSRLLASHTAEDILQEALLHAWRDRNAFEWRGIKSFRSWLLSVIDHRIHDIADRDTAAKRGSGRTLVALAPQSPSQTTDASGAMGLPSITTTPSRLAMYREQAESMKLALEALPEELREAVRLRVFEQMSLEEIAQRLGLGVSAVQHRFRKGSELYARRLRVAEESRPHAGNSAMDPARKASPRTEA